MNDYTIRAHLERAELSLLRAFASEMSGLINDMGVPDPGLDDLYGMAQTIRAEYDRCRFLAPKEPTTEVASHRLREIELERDIHRLEADVIRFAERLAERVGPMFGADVVRLVRDKNLRITELETALKSVAAIQPITLSVIEANGFVFTDIGREPGNWQHLAFSVYTDLCEADTIARTALKDTTDE